MMRIIFRLLRLMNDAQSIRRGTYGKRLARRHMRRGIRRFFR